MVYQRRNCRNSSTSNGFRHYPNGHRQRGFDVLEAFQTKPLSPRRQQSLTTSHQFPHEGLRELGSATPSTESNHTQFLRALYHVAGADASATRDTAPAVTASLAIVAFFYAMRSCEHTTTRDPGRTKKIDMGHVVFRDARKRILTNDCLISTAEYVTIMFVDQKNGEKMGVQTQQQTGDPILCPVRQAHSLVTRIRAMVPNHSDKTPLNTLHLNGRTVSISSTYLLRLLRNTCRDYGDKKTFGFHHLDIGTHSLRSGGAMALFLHDHPVHKIMIFGRWSSDAFLAYIRPQVLEWTNNMSRDMIKHDSFLDASDTRRSHREDPRVRRPFNGPQILMPSLHLFH
jgi:hypothetical protein